MDDDDYYDKKENLKIFINQLNEGTINYSDLPEEFQKNKEKIKIPTKPVEPAEDECCGTGCRPCVFDLYTMRLEKYQEELEELFSILYE